MLVFLGWTLRATPVARASAVHTVFLIVQVLVPLMWTIETTTVAGRSAEFAFGGHGRSP